MASQHPSASSAFGVGMATGREAGSVVRAARLRAGLTLADLGRQCGYSASQISRYERGVQLLTDVTLLRRFAEALAIPYEMLGLTAPSPGAGARHAGVSGVNHRMIPTAGPNVVPEFRREDGDDPVRRRDLLAGAVELAGAGAVFSQAPNRIGTANVLSSGLDDLLYYGHPVGPLPATTLRAAVSAVRQDFQTARYDRLSAELPGLISAAVATRQCAASGEAATACSLLAEAYIVAANLMVKLNDDPLALTLADRALQSAEAGDDPLTLADARRAVATVLRRTGRRAKAQDLLLSAAGAIEPGHGATHEQLSMYGTLLEVAAYTAAVDGNRAAAREFIDEAKAAAGRLGKDANYRYTAFGPANVTLYQVSIAQVLGDSGTAIEHARTLVPAAIPTAERQGRYWIDVARAYHQWHKPSQCYRALLAAERAAPAEVRYRPPVHRMAEDLLRADRGNLPGLRAFGRRIGMPVV